MYRRQEQDKFQTRIFLFVMAAAIASGLGSGINYNLVMLVLVPLGFVLCIGLQSYSTLAAGEKVEAQEPIRI
jgi:hypothetical protein